MSVAGYEKIKTKVIEGKKKCIYKKYKGTKLYVKGFGKMRTVESYVKLCKKAAAKKAAKAVVKSKNVRSKSSKKYGGFLQEFFANIEPVGDKESFAEKKEKYNNPHLVNSKEVVKQHFNNDSEEGYKNSHTDDMNSKTGGFKGKNSIKKGGNELDNFQNTVGNGISGGYRGGNNNRSRGGNEMLTTLQNTVGNGISTLSSSFSGGYRGGNNKSRGGNEMLTTLQNTVGSGISTLSSSFSGGYRGGNNNRRGGQLDQFQDNTLDQFQDISHDGGGKHKKRNKVHPSIFGKLMMAATFKKNSVKKGKKRKGGGGDGYPNDDVFKKI